MDRSSGAHITAMYKKDQRPTKTQFSRIRITPPPPPPVPAAGYPLQDRQDVPAPLDPDPPDPLAGASSSISSSVSNSVSSSLSSSAIDELQAASSRFTGSLSTFSLVSSAAVKSARDNGLQDGSASAAASARTSASSVIASATAQAAAVLSQASSISSSASLILAAMTGGASVISSIQESASNAVDAAQSIASSSAQSAIDAAIASASAVVRNNVDGTQTPTPGISTGQLAGIIIGTAIASSVISTLFTLFLIRYRRRKATEAEGSTAFNPNSRQPGRPVFSAGQDNMFEFPNYTTGIGYPQHTPSNSFPPETKHGHSSTVKSRPVRISILAGRPLPSVPSTIPSEPITPVPYPSEPNTPGRSMGEPGFGLGLYSSDTEHDPSSPITISTTSVRRDTRGDLAPMIKFSLTRKRSNSGGQRMQLVRVGNKKDSIHRLLSQAATPPNAGRRMNKYSKTEEEEHTGAEIDRETTASAAETTRSGEGSQYQLPSLSDMSSLGLNPMKYGRSLESSLASSSNSSKTSIGKDNNQVPKREHPRPRSSPAAPGRRTTRTSELFLQSIPPPPLPLPLPFQPPAQQEQQQQQQQQQQPVSHFSPYSTPTRSSMSMSLPSSPPPPPMPPLRVPSLQAPIPRRPHIAASVMSLDQQLQVRSPPRSQSRPRTAPKSGAGAAGAATAAPATFSLFPRD
ncbi:hypothetical protein F4775DRAFT_169653 [Biscogniauxia sp. FL1348]|nr:hypothetical protein F4775DRAFT_169653 [Biscogniauxia sp. FL1348]